MYWQREGHLVVLIAFLLQFCADVCEASRDRDFCGQQEQCWSFTIRFVQLHFHNWLYQSALNSFELHDRSLYQPVREEKWCAFCGIWQRQGIYSGMRASEEYWSPKLKYGSRLCGSIIWYALSLEDMTCRSACGKTNAVSVWINALGRTWRSWASWTIY